MILRKHSKANPIAQGNGILSIFPPLEMSRGAKGLPSEGEMFLYPLPMQNSCNKKNPRRVQLF